MAPKKLCKEQKKKKEKNDISLGKKSYSSILLRFFGNKLIVFDMKWTTSVEQMT